MDKEPSSNSKFLKTFQENVKKKIKRYQPKELKKRDEKVAAQRILMYKLLELETQFRDMLWEHKWGKVTFTAFCDYVSNEMRSLLDARPFFRERQVTFTSKISNAIKNKDFDVLVKCGYNYRFVDWVCKHRRWRKEFYDIAAQMKEIRDELAVTNLPLAIGRAKIHAKSIQRDHLAHLDLIQIATEGLMAGIDKQSLPKDPRKFDGIAGVAIGRMVGSLVEAGSVDSKTILVTCKGEAKKISEFVPGDMVYGVNNRGEIIETEVLALHDHGILDGFKVTFEDGYQIVCSKDHKFLTEQGMLAIKDIVDLQLGIYGSPSKVRGVADALWQGISGKANDQRTSQGMSQMSRADTDSEQPEAQTTQNPQKTSGRMDVVVWPELRFEKRSSKTRSGMPDLCENEKGGSGGWYHGAERKMEGGKPGKNAGISCSEKIDFLGENGFRPSLSATNFAKCEGDLFSVGEGASRGGGSPSLQANSFSETVKDGAVGQKICGVVGCSDSLRGGKEAGGPCVTGSQDMDRSGRDFPFPGNLSSPGTRKSTGEGRDAEGRVSKARGCYATSTSLGCLQDVDRGTKAGMEGDVFATSPLTSAGDLVLRRVVRVRAVGPRRMYDLEVAHPKHNFLLPNGVVTSNSETLLHFVPNDKRKLYRAHQIKARNPDVDPKELAKMVNEGVPNKKGKIVPIADPNGRTNPDEIAVLLNAASHVSSDYTSPEGDATEKARVNIVKQYEDTTGNRPDILTEEADLENSLFQAVGQLTVFEQKFLRLKGVGA